MCVVISIVPNEAILMITHAMPLFYGRPNYYPHYHDYDFKSGAIMNSRWFEQNVHGP